MVKLRGVDAVLDGARLDFYFMLLLSFVVGVLGMFNVVDAGIVAAATLATLGVVAIGALAGRTRLAALTSATSELVSLMRESEAPSAERLLAPSTSGLDVELRAASDIRMVGVTLGRTIRNQIVALERSLASGARVRIAVIAPSDQTLQEAARRSTTPGSPEIFEHRLRSTLDLLRWLDGTHHGGRLEIRLLDFVPAFGLLIVDPSEVHGRLDVDIYSHRPNGPEPVLRLRADRDRQWYHHFLGEFDRIWAAGVPIGSSAGPPAATDPSVPP